MLKIVTDSTACFSREYLEKNDIKLVSLYVCLDGKYYKEGTSENLEELLAPVKNNLNTITTSQPSPSDFHEAFKEIIDEGDEILCIVTSSKLSGTYSCANLCRDMFSDEEKERIHIVDSKVTSAGINLLVDRALDYIKKGFSSNEVVNLIIEDTKVIKSVITVDNLSTVIRSGRISKVAGALAGLFNMRPILKIEKDGTVGMITKTKGKNSQLKSFISELNGEFSYLYYIASDRSSIREELIKEINSKTNIIVKEVPTSAVILGIGGDTSFAAFLI